MRLYRYIGTSPLRSASAWLRASLAALMLAFTLNLAAHAAHTHDDASVAQAAHAAACAYCVTFGSLADTPAAHDSCVALLPVIADFAPLAAGLSSWRVETAARPRAPPLS